MIKAIMVRKVAEKGIMMMEEDTTKIMTGIMEAIMEEETSEVIWISGEEIWTLGEWIFNKINY